MPIVGDRYAFTKEDVDKSPDEKGVYALYDGNVLIYYGRASGTRLRLGRASKATSVATKAVAHNRRRTYRREVNSRPVAREAELLAEFEKTYGRLPRCNERRA